MIQKHIQETEKKQSNQGLKAEFEKLKSEKVEKATTKIVNFKVLVGCGCGGSYAKYHAEVPIDKDIDNGDYYGGFEPWMENIKEGWV